MKTHPRSREAIYLSYIKSEWTTFRVSPRRKDRGMLLQTEVKRLLLVEADPGEKLITGRVLALVGSHTYVPPRPNVGSEVHRMLGR